MKSVISQSVSKLADDLRLYYHYHQGYHTDDIGNIAKIIPKSYGILYTMSFQI